MAIDDQALKDALRAIELGEIPEDLDLPDPEEYDDMGGIKSLDRRVPSIKMASETGDEEAQMEIGQMLEAFQEAVRQGFQGTVKEFSDYYFGQMKQDMQMDEDRAMAMYGGSMRAQYATGTPQSSEIEALIRGLKGSADQQEMAKKMKLRELMPEFEKNAELVPERQSRMEKDYPDSMKKKYNFMELADSSNDALKEELLDRKYNAKNYPPSQRNMSMEELKRMFKKAKEDKLKRAKGGIAGVL